jgi:hypothetical protein
VFEGRTEVLFDAADNLRKIKLRHKRRALVNESKLSGHKHLLEVFKDLMGVFYIIGVGSFDFAQDDGGWSVGYVGRKLRLICL